MNGITTLIKEAPRELAHPFHRVRIQQEVLIHEPGFLPSLDTESASILMSDSPASRKKK